MALEIAAPAALQPEIFGSLLESEEIRKVPADVPCGKPFRVGRFTVVRQPLSRFEEFGTTGSSAGIREESLGRRPFLEEPEKSELPVVVLTSPVETGQKRRVLHFQTSCEHARNIHVRAASLRKSNTKTSLSSTTTATTTTARLSADSASATLSSAQGPNVAATTTPTATAATAAAAPAGASAPKGKEEDSVSKSRRASFKLRVDCQTTTKTRNFLPRHVNRHSMVEGEGVSPSLLGHSRCAPGGTKEATFAHGRHHRRVSTCHFFPSQSMGGD